MWVNRDCGLQIFQHGIEADILVVLHRITKQISHRGVNESLRLRSAIYFFHRYENTFDMCRCNISQLNCANYWSDVITVVLVLSVPPAGLEFFSGFTRYI